MWSCVVSLLPRVFFQHSNESEAPEGVLTRHARNSGQQRGIDAVGLGSGVVDGEIASGIYLRGSSFSEEGGVFKAVLCWQAPQSPEADYSTFVHLASVGQIVVPDELVASSDHLTPVDGWRPTSGWRRGEVVCDAHAIVLPGETDFDYVIAGMYTRNATGAFDLLGAFRWVRTPTGWDAM